MPGGTLPTNIIAGSTGHIGDHNELHQILTDFEAGEVWVPAGYRSGGIASRPSPGRAGFVYRSVDEGPNGQLYLDTGSAWIRVSDAFYNEVFDLRQGTRNIKGLQLPVARVGLNNNIAVPTSSLSWTVIQWENDSGANFADNDSLWDAGQAGRFTASRDGFWWIGAYIRWAADTDGQRHIRVQKNNNVVLGRDSRPAAAEIEHQTLGSMLIELETGDYVQVEVSHNAGNSLDVHNNSVAWFAYHSGEF